MTVSQTDINNANIDLQNAQIALITAQSNYQQAQSKLNQLTAQQSIDGLTAANVSIAASLIAQATQQVIPS